MLIYFSYINFTIFIIISHSFLFLIKFHLRCLINSEYNNLIKNRNNNKIIYYLFTLTVDINYFCL